MREVKKMSKDLMIYFDEEGVAKAYDDTYDITIHCESEEEQQKAIEQLKSLQWIPCSERLPDRFGKMLVTFIPGTLWTYVIIANYSDLMGIAKPCFWIGNVGKNDFANITSHVVAWMPLPEPYREDDHE